MWGCAVEGAEDGAVVMKLEEGATVEGADVGVNVEDGFVDGESMLSGFSTAIK